VALTLVTPPAAEPVSLTEAKAHLRVEITDDDTVITNLITTARVDLENATSRAWITQTWDLVLDDFPASDEIKIPRPPLQSVTSITYKDKDGNSFTFDAANYVVDVDAKPGRVVLADASTWPGATLYPAGAVRVRFVAGYGDADDVPKPLRQALLLLLGHYYENREAVLVSAGINPAVLPLAIDRLIAHYREWSF